MINWKIAAGFAAFGAFVSLLAGIIGGNPFGVVLLRLVLSSVVCGGVGLCLNLVANKFLPELTSTSPVRAEESGEAVDIVIDDEITLADQPTETVAADTEVPDLQPVESVEFPESLESMESAAEIGQEEAPLDLSEEVEETEEDVLSFEGPDTGEVPEYAEAAPSGPAVSDFEDLDTLPDIDRFSPSAEEGEPTPKKSKMSAQVEEVVRDQDPENLARAVRTFMKKDQ